MSDMNGIKIKEKNSQNSDIGGMLKDTAILFAITLIAGLLLGLVYQITKDPIAAQKEKAKKAAYKEVFADAGDFKEEELAQIGDSEWKGAGFEAVSVDEVIAAKASDSSDSETLGYVITVTTKEGYSGDISFTIGIRNDGTVNGISLLAISETAGLGMKAGEVLSPQFKGKNVEKFEYTKTGAAADNQIDAISGATITTNAVTNGVNAGLYYFQTQLKGGSGNE